MNAILEKNKIQNQKKKIIKEKEKEVKKIRFDYLFYYKLNKNNLIINESVLKIFLKPLLRIIKSRNYLNMKIFNYYYTLYF